MGGKNEPRDLTGFQTKYLTVLCRDTDRKGWYWLSLCVCGNLSSRFGGNLTRPKPVESCGCKSRLQTAIRARKHGHSAGGGRDKVARAHHSMLSRCYRPNSSSYKNYGGRGISVCDAWRFGEEGLSGLECFVRDMGLPGPGLTLDRIDTNGRYDKDNCRWATVQAQARNKRNVNLIDGLPKTVYAAQQGLCLSTAYKRAKARGISVETAIREMEKK